MSNDIPDSESLQDYDFVQSQNDTSTLAGITSQFHQLSCPQGCQLICFCTSNSQLNPSILSIQDLKGIEFTTDDSHQLSDVTMQANMSLSMPLYPPPMHSQLSPETMQTIAPLPYSISTQHRQPPLVVHPSGSSKLLFLQDFTIPSLEPLHPIQGTATEQKQQEQALQTLVNEAWSSMCEQALLEQHEPGSTVTTTDEEPEGRSAARAQSGKNRDQAGISLEEKEEAIDLVCRNRMHFTWKELSERREDIQKFVEQASVVNPPFTMKACHVIQSTFYTMETLLIKWLVDLQEQQVPTPEQCIQWQAYAVHRMLSGLSHEPLPPHKFSSGWLLKFMERNHLEEGKPSNKIVVKDASLELSKLQGLLHDYAMDDIYFCDVTSIFALPACVSSHRGRACQLLSRRQRTISSCERGPGISLLLFCNASGTVKREPVMLDRLFQTSPGLRRMTFAGWLVAFNNKLERDVLLLVSVTVWEQIKDRLRGLTLSRVRIEAVPAQLNAWLPTRTGIAREFKAYVNAINFEWTLNIGSHVGNIYQVAMQQVQVSVIQQCFRRFEEAVQGLEPGEISKELSPAQRRLKGVLTVAHGEEDKSNRGVFEYYLNQGSDIGPSAFLCAEIQTMLSSSDVEGFLDASGHGTRPVCDWWNFVVVNQ